MLTEKMIQLCHNLEIPVPTPTPLGEYFIPLEDSLFVMIQELHNSTILWSRITTLPTDNTAYAPTATEIGRVSMKLLTGLTSAFFPVPFIMNYEVRLAVVLPIQTDKKLLDALAVLAEDVGLWKEQLRIDVQKPIINHTSRILKF